MKPSYRRLFAGLSVSAAALLAGCGSTQTVTVTTTPTSTSNASTATDHVTFSGALSGTLSQLVVTCNPGHGQPGQDVLNVSGKGSLNGKQYDLVVVGADLSSATVTIDLDDGTSNGSGQIYSQQTPAGIDKYDPASGATVHATLTAFAMPAPNTPFPFAAPVGSKVTADALLTCP